METRNLVKLCSCKDIKQLNYKCVQINGEIVDPACSFNQKCQEQISVIKQF